MLKVIILEDNDYQADYIKNIVSKRQMINITPYTYDMKLLLQTADPQEIIDSLQADDYLAILDVELANNKLTGIDVAEKIRQTANFAEIIFVTAYQKYLPFTISRRIEPFDYISKGDDIASITDRLRQDIDEAYSRYQAYLNSNQSQQINFTYEVTRGVKRQIPLSDLYYIESIKNENRRLRIIGRNIRIECHGELRLIDNEHLFRISQSALVNPKTIVEFNKKDRLVYFDQNHEISLPVSYRKVRELNNLLKNSH